MGTELYGIDPKGQGAQNDAHFSFYVYSGTTGALLPGMPVYQSVTDAAEYNNAFAGTALSPARQATGGNVTIGTDATAVNLFCVGVYQPESDFTIAPAQGDVIRVLDRGVGLVRASAIAAGTTVKVQDILIADAAPGATALSNGNTYVAGRTIGIVLATSTFVAAAAVIIALPGAGTTTRLVNARVRLT